MKISTSEFLKLISATLLIFFITSNLHATVCTFTNGGGDNLWTNAANWDSGFVPGTNDEVLISTGTLNISPDITVSSFTISNTATVNFNHPGTSYIGILSISGGALNTTNKLVVSDGFNWSGTSTLSASGAYAEFELATTCVTLIAGSGNKNLYGNMTNKGTVTHTGGTLRLQTDGQFTNNGTYTVDGATFIINSGGVSFLNNGIFNKNSVPELSLFTVFNQTGSAELNINAGSLSFLSDGNNSDSTEINIAETAVLNISAGNYSLGSDSSINGEGDIDFKGGTAMMEGSYNLNGTTIISGGTVNFDQGIPTEFTNLTLSAGSIQGNSQLIVNNTFRWTGTSAVQSSDTLFLSALSNSLFYTGGSKNLHSVIVNHGNISHTEGNFNFNTGAVFENYGSYILNGPTGIFDYGGGNFENKGIFEHQNTGLLNFYPDFKNDTIGSVKGKGTIEFSNLINLGTFIADAESGTLNLTGNYSNGSRLEIGFDGIDFGKIIVSNDITLSGDLELSISGTVPAGTYTILSSTSGTISGSFDNEYLAPEFSLQYTATEVNVIVGLLPVELIRFNVEKDGINTLLQWQTASEHNSKNFLIEHSTDGLYFQTIGEVAAAGTSNTIKDYRFVHDTPANGFHYYRLRQQDHDGLYEYSDIRVMYLNNFEKNLTFYPNPTFGNVTIKNQSEIIYHLTIRDLSGRIMYTKESITPGTTELDLYDLPKSMYILEIFDDFFFSHKEKLMILE